VDGDVESDASTVVLSIVDSSTSTSVNAAISACDAGGMPCRWLKTMDWNRCLNAPLGPNTNCSHGPSNGVVAFESDADDDDEDGNHCCACGGEPSSGIWISMILLRIEPNGEAPKELFVLAGGMAGTGAGAEVVAAETAAAVGFATAVE